MRLRLDQMGAVGTRPQQRGGHSGHSLRWLTRYSLFNLFNVLNLNPGSVGTVVSSGSFGRDTTPLSGRTISFQGRFSF